MHAVNVKPTKPPGRHIGMIISYSFAGMPNLHIARSETYVGRIRREEGENGVEFIDEFVCVDTLGRNVRLRIR